uniref:Uncharacterized protein n=1 Tax=Anopheles atroparvus TaxID=41427 RepID=A0A182IY68_ANOAO
MSRKKSTTSNDPLVQHCLSNPTMEHHGGLFADISNSFPGNGGLPSTNVKYHLHNPPQPIPPQPPPPPGPTLGPLPSRQYHQYHHPHPQQQQQQQQQQHQLGAQLHSHSQAASSVTAAQYGTGSSIATNGGSGGGSGGVPGASAPTIINISNNNHNIMAPPYPYHGPPQYQTKMASGGAAAAGATAAGGYKELGKYGTPGSTGTSGTGGGGWSEYATTHHHHEASVIGNFEAKNPNKYHHSTTPGAGVGGRVTGGYRYASEYLPSQQGQPGGMTAHYPTGGAGAGYGLYHPEGVQATPISPQTQPPSAGAAHPGYDPYPHIVRNKYPSGGGGQPPHMASGSRPTPMASHPDLMYNERSQRYVNSYATGSLYMPSAGTAGSTGASGGAHGTYHSQMGPGKGMMNPGMDYYGNSFVKQLSSHHPHHAAPNPYIPPNRMAYATQQSASYHPHPGHHHGVALAHHKSVSGSYGYGSSNGAVASYEDPYHQRAMGARVPLPHPYPTDAHHQQQSTNAAPYGTTAPPSSYHHQVQAGMGYPNPKITFSKTMNDFYTPNMAPSGTAQEQINSSKILKGPTASSAMSTGGAPMYDTNHPLNYDCQQMYLKNRYMHSKPVLVPPVPTGGYTNGQPIMAGELHPSRHPHAHHHLQTVTAYGGYTTMEDLGLGPRSFALDEHLKDKSLRDYLTSWSEMEEEDGSMGPKITKEANNNQTTHQNYESCKYMNQQTAGEIVAAPVPAPPHQESTAEVVSAAMDTLVAPETPPQVAQPQPAPIAAHTGVIVANVQNAGNLPDILVDIEKPAKPEETGKDGEKLYILETYDVPQSELNKYKHLSVINELPKNVVPINDSADSLKFLEEIESNREKYYQTELESEVVYEEKEREKLKEEDCEGKSENEVKSEQAESDAQQTVIRQPKDEETVESKETDAECRPEAEEDMQQPKVETNDSLEESPLEEPVKEMSPEEKPEDLSKLVIEKEPEPEVPVEVVAENQPAVIDKPMENPQEKESHQVEQPTDDEAFKVPRCFPKYRKRRFYDYDLPRFPKKARRSSIEEFINCDIPKFKVQTLKRSPKSLKSLLLDTINSKPFRRWAKEDWFRQPEMPQERREEDEAKEPQPEQAPSVDKVEEEEVQEEGNRPEPEECVVPSQEVELEGSVILTTAVPIRPPTVPSLRELCYEQVRSSELFLQPPTLKELCEKVICVNKHLYIIEEMRSDPPKLQDLCKAVLSETNIFIDVTENDVCIIENGETGDVVMESDEPRTRNGGRVFIVEEDRGSIADLLRESVQLQAEDLMVVRTDSGEECEDHEIFLANLAPEEPMVSVRSLLSDSENDIFSRVEQEIEKMMHTSSSEDEAEVSVPLEPEKELETSESELFAFSEDVECVQYEEVIPLVNNEETSAKNAIINTLRLKYASRPSTDQAKLRQRLLRKYLIYQRCIQLRHDVFLRSAFPWSKLIAKRMAAIVPVEPSPVQQDEDTNCSVSSSSSSSSSSSCSSSTAHRSSLSSSSSSSSSSSGSDVEEEDTIELVETVESTPEELSSASVQFTEANNNKVQLVPLEMPPKSEVTEPLVHDESQPEIAKPTPAVCSPVQSDDSGTSCSSHSNGKCSPSSSATPSSSPASTSSKSNRSPSSSSFDHRMAVERFVGERPRSVIVSPPVAKRKKKLSFEESLLNIDQMYRKPSSPSTSSMMHRSVASSSPASTARPNVIVNVDNKREVARKLIIPSYKIFDQSMDEMQTMEVNGRHRKSSAEEARLVQPTLQRHPPRRRTSISAVPTFVRSISSEVERRTQGLERRRSAVMRRRSCCCSPLRSLGGSPPSVTKPSTVVMPLLSAVPYVRLVRNDYVEKLAESYRRQQK